jgi:hypothetical protein
MIPTHSGKVLNLCGDSKRRSAVIFRTVAQNKFINCLRLSRAGRNFPTTDWRYADKLLRKRDFFCSSEQGSPDGVSSGGVRSRLLFQKRGRATISIAIVAVITERISPPCSQRRIAPRENTGARKFHKPAAAEERDCKKKKPGTAGLFDENLFRSVHFASFAI